MENDDSSVKNKNLLLNFLSFFTESLKITGKNSINNDNTSSKSDSKEIVNFTVEDDPRFQQTNQTLRCWVMYTDFYRCEKILGDNHNACGWFKDVFTSVCPIEWIENWNSRRTHDSVIFPWHKRNQGPFSCYNYGK